VNIFSTPRIIPRISRQKPGIIPVSKRIRPQTLDAAYSLPEELFRSLRTSEQGLSDTEAKSRLVEYGYNSVTYDRPVSVFSQFFRNFSNPFVALLSVLSVVSFLLGDIPAGSLILLMVTISVLLRFVQEYRSTRTVARLRALVSTTVTVSRTTGSGKNEDREIPLREVVPGDVISLRAGDMIPGDVRLLTARDLFVSESVLSGEALPTEKFDALQPSTTKGRGKSGKEMLQPSDLENLCFMGTNVVSGTATALVVATGSDTLFASFVERTRNQRSFTSFDQGINSISWLLIRFMFAILPVVLLLNGLTKADWGSALLFALSVAVGLTPEMLPVIIAANLTRGAVSMVRNKVIVKRLNSIENLGAMNVLCTDKTGTLTIDRIILEHHLDILGNSDDDVLRYVYLNSYFQTGLKNLLDAAVLEHGELHEALHISENYRKVDEIPFDFERRRMSVVLEKERQQHELICKGAVEEVLAACSSAKLQGKIVPLSPKLRESVLFLRDELSMHGLRVLAVACKEISADQASHKYLASDEHDLVLMGFIAFLDPPKESASEALAALQREGIKVKILTGDSELVARRICEWVDLEVKNVLLGSEVESLTEEELKSAAIQTTLFAKLTPLQKSRVISALKATGNTVGFLGDGINDAAALREADVGISVDTAVDVAKESADIIMLEKSLTGLVNVVIEGRRNSANIVKYIKMAASSNFGNVLTILGSSAFFAFLPMLPLQLLVQNLLYDLSQTTIPFDPVDSEDLARPRRWESQGIARFMLVFGPISSIFDFATFALLWWLFGVGTGEQRAFFQSGWFVEGLLSQTLIVHMIRTRKIPFLQSWACPPLLATTIIVMVAGALLPFTNIGAAVGLVRLPLVYFFWLSGILVAYCLLSQAVKTWFLRRYKSWI
jgi:P-type Mg2+ transporter